jgi:hypothetical protein
VFNCFFHIMRNQIPSRQNNNFLNLNGATHLSSESSNRTPDARPVKRAKGTSSTSVGEGTGSAHRPGLLRNQLMASQVDASSPSAAERELIILNKNNALKKEYKSALWSAAETDAGDGGMMVGENVCKQWGSTAAKFLGWASKPDNMHDIAAKNKEVLKNSAELKELQGWIAKYLEFRHPVDNTGKRSPAGMRMKQTLDAFLQWRITGEVKLRHYAVIAITAEHQRVVASNNRLKAKYKTKLQSAATKLASDGKMMIEESVCGNRSSAAVSFLHWANIGEHDIAAKNNKELQGLITDYIDFWYPVDDTGKHSAAGEKMKGILKTFLHWRETKKIKPRKGAVRAMTVEHQQLVERNNQLETEYKTDLQSAAKVPASDGGMLIGKLAPRILGGAAAGFLQWASDSKNMHDIAAKNKEVLKNSDQLKELQGWIAKYLEFRHPVDDTGKRPTAAEKTKSKLGAFLHWRVTGEIRPRKGVVPVMTAEHQQQVARNNQLETAYRDALNSAATPEVQDPMNTDERALQNVLTELDVQSLDVTPAVPGSDDAVAVEVWDDDTQRSLWALIRAEPEPDPEYEPMSREAADQIPLDDVLHELSVAGVLL